ncbi:expressed unknown protein [Seminavis robusta]|uniref:Uncharacterized protein n=1 Tax=Seminavis robusta TaxID=568900 RepID=A0A9N8DE96_9STRA|nr:expressed unknown protein [Seminavis robusta]|eukprot:Sro114_g056550.1 n/a (211) ;mRNA; f:111219-111851
MKLIWNLFVSALIVLVGAIQGSLAHDRNVAKIGAKLRAARRMLSVEDGPVAFDSVEAEAAESNSSCITKEVLLFGENLYTEATYFNSFGEGIPQPLDQEVFNLPLYDAAAYLENSTVVEIGSIQEQVLYVPPSTTDIASLQCLGRSVWTFADGQLSDSYTCINPTDGVMITGGTGSYACANGYADLVDLTADYFEGGGYIVWKLVYCGGC